MKQQARSILLAVVLGCASMALVETVFLPGYVIKSAVKLTLFGGSVLIFGGRGLLGRDGLRTAAWLGVGIYVLLMAAFVIFRPFLDPEAIAAGLREWEQITRSNFLWVALYISLVNSLLEELFFRGLGYLRLRDQVPEGFAMVFSAAAFSLYHVPMLAGQFLWWVHGLCLAGLFVGGLIFNRLDRRGSVLPSWLAHAAANLAINTIGFTMLSASV